jgi:hypothetical protein
MRGKLFLFSSMILDKYPPAIIEKKEIANQSHHFAFQTALSFCRGKVPLDKLTSEVTRNLLLYKGTLCSCLHL